MLRVIRYGIEKETGIVVSEVDGVMAYPVLDFAAIGQGGDGYAPGDFNGPTRYYLEKLPAAERYQVYPGITWTKGRGNTHGVPPIPLEIRNRHRAFWGFKPLKEER